MNNITQTETTMNSNKDIKLTYCTKSGSNCNYSSNNSIIRGSSLTGNVINQTTGNLTLTNIIVDGNNVSATTPLLAVSNSRTLNLNSGTTVKRGKKIVLNIVGKESM